MLLTHSPSGDTFRATIFDSAGAAILNIITIGATSVGLVAGVEYEIEVVIDSIAGTYRLFLDGVLYGTQTPGIWTRGVSASRFYLGASPAIYNTAQASFDDYIFFDNSQHTANYVPGYVSPDVLYGKRSVTNETTFFADYANDINGTLGGGNLVATTVGAPVVTGGRLDLTAASSGVQYDGLNNFDSLQEGELEFDFIPPFTGSVTGTLLLFALADTGGSTINEIQAFISGSNLTYRIFNSANAPIFSKNVSVASFVTGIPVKMNFTYDLNTGASRVFFNGVQQGTTQIETGTRSVCNGLALGRNFGLTGSSRLGFSIDNLVMLNKVLHTADFVPTVSIYEFTGDAVTLPLFNYSGQGVIQSFEGMSSTQTGDIHYIIGNKYWDGTAWVASDGTYAQANTIADVNTNLPSFSALGLISIEIKMIFSSSNTQQNIDVLDLTYTGQQYASEGTLLTNNSFVANDVTSFLATEILPANTAVLYAIEVGGVCMYWDGIAWVVSNCTSAEANTLADIQANIATLLSSNASLKIVTILTTTDPDVSTPEVDIITVTYNFGALEPSAPSQCQVYGFVKNAEDIGIENATVTARPNRDVAEYVEGGNRLIVSPIIKTTDVDGFFSMNLIISSEFEVSGLQPMQFILTIQVPNQESLVSTNGLDGTNSKMILFEVPNLASVNITDQIGAI